MSARRIDQIWLFGGLALIVLLVAGGWFLLINPKHAETAEVETATQDTEIQLTRAKNSFAALKKEAEKLDEYEAQLAEYQAALPVTSKTNGIPDFLKELQKIGLKLDVDVSGYSASAQEASKEVTSAKVLPITLNVEGAEPENISKFLKQLQNVQPRAVQIDTVSLTSKEDSVEMTLTLNAYVTSTETAKIG